MSSLNYGEASIDNSKASSLRHLSLLSIVAPRERHRQAKRLAIGVHERERGDKGLGKPLDTVAFPIPVLGAARSGPEVSETMIVRDRNIRSHLHGRLEQETKGALNALVVDELTVASGLARLDLAVLNDVSVHGFEIKGETDSLARLPRQIEYFSAVTDFMTLVVVERFERGALSIIPAWWGLAVARWRGNAMSVELRRECSPNPTIHVLTFLEFLWRDEAYALLAEYGSVHCLKTATKDRLYRELAEQIPWNQLHDLVLLALRARLASKLARGLALPYRVGADD